MTSRECGRLELNDHDGVVEYDFMTVTDFSFFG